MEALVYLPALVLASKEKGEVTKKVLFKEDGISKEEEQTAASGKILFASLGGAAGPENY